MVGSDFPIHKYLRTLKTRQQIQYSEIIKAQNRIERKMLQLNELACKNMELSQNIYIKTQQVFQGALISALLGVCIVLIIEGFEIVFPQLQHSILYTICKTSILCVFTLFYILRSANK